MAPQRKTVLLVDDHPVVSAGIRLLLNDSPEFAICGEAADIENARRKTETLRPDLIVADLQMGRQSVLDVIGDFLTIHPPARILVYSNQEEIAYARRVLRAGAQGYMMKSAGLQMLVEALRALARGDRWFSPQVQRAFLEELATGKAMEGAPIDLLSNRELQVFQLLGAGLSSSKIAVELGLSIKTVGSYRENLKIKLGMKTARDLERGAEVYVKTGRINW